MPYEEDKVEQAIDDIDEGVFHKKWFTRRFVQIYGAFMAALGFAAGLLLGKGL